MYKAIDASSKLLFNWHVVNTLDKVLSKGSGQGQVLSQVRKVAFLRAGLTIHKQGIGLSHLPAFLLQWIRIKG